MENKSNEATPQRPEGSRTLDASLVTMDLDHFMEQVLSEPTWKESDRNSITIFKTNGLRLVLIALHEGAEMKTHTANGIITIQVLEGVIRFTTDRQSVEVSKGQIVALHERIPHSVLAKKETVFLLTLTTTLSAD
jgi:quercetin dioxygenase-like cupin family protein